MIVNKFTMDSPAAPNGRILFYRNLYGVSLQRGKAGKGLKIISIQRLLHRSFLQRKTFIKMLKKP